MKIEEKIDNYLIGLGCSISNEYAYIIDDTNSSLKKTPKEEHIKICGKEILLSTKVLATVFLDKKVPGLSSMELE